MSKALNLLKLLAAAWSIHVGLSILLATLLVVIDGLINTFWIVFVYVFTGWPIALTLAKKSTGRRANAIQAQT